MGQLRESLAESSVVSRGDYEYFVHPVTDGIPAVEPALLREVADGVAERVDFADVDRIVTPESMGIHHATAVSLRTGTPFVVLRKRAYGFDDEIAVHQSTAYDGGELYLNGVGRGDRVVVVDDVVSSGGTLRAVTEAVEAAGATVADAVVVVRRADGEPDADVPDAKSLVTVSVSDGTVVVADEE